MCDVSEGHTQLMHIECYNKLHNKDFKPPLTAIQNEDTCENCGKPVSKIKGHSLFARDMKDDQGRNIVMMLCPSCMKVKV